MVAAPLVALLVAGGLAVAGSAVEAPAEVAARVLASRDEQEAVAVLEALPDEDLRRLPFDGVEALIQRSWWQAASAVIRRSHQVRADFTAPVRRATGEAKREADVLLKWLDPRFANPAATPMALRWAQNSTVVMLVARFAPKWDSPGANLAVFSTERGRGHVDPQKTAERIRSMLNVSISGGHVRAEITADTANVRNRYTLVADLFDEVVPERSEWTLEFRRAQGSMQMSTGAQIPELHVTLRKRWPGALYWPRLGVVPAASAALEPGWLAEAPGLAASDLEAMRGGAVLSESAATCSRGSAHYCASSGACVAGCDGCEGMAVLRAAGGRCLGLPQAGDCTARSGLFVDEDLDQGRLAGRLRWDADPHSLAEAFELLWAGEGDVPLAGVEPLAWLNASLVDAEPSFTLPPGSSAPAGAVAVLIYASNEAGRTLLACATVEDRVRPPPPRGLRFADVDPRRNVAGGVVELDPPEDVELVQGYELRWGRAEEPLTLDEPPLLEVPAPEGGSAVVEIPLPSDGLRILKGTTQLLALAVGPGGARSLPAAANFTDAAPPNVVPSRLTATPDREPKVHRVSSDISVHPGNCDARPSAVKSTPCDLGSEYVVYWRSSDGAKLGEALGSVPVGGRGSLSLESAPVPVGASGIIAVAKNEHGEMVSGASADLRDDRGESAAVWAAVAVVAACNSGGVAFWMPFPVGGTGAVTVPSPDAAALRMRLLSAVAIGQGGRHLLLGQEDGTVHFLELAGGSWESRQTVAGPGSVSALALDAGSLRMLRGGKFGQLDLWTLKDGLVAAHLQGHTGRLTALDVDWANDRAVSASEDGTVRQWDLSSGSCTRTIEVGRIIIFDVAVDWLRSRAVAALADESMRLFDLATGSQLSTLEGHSEPVQRLAADFGRGRLLSVARDRTVKLWDLESRECLLTFRSTDSSKITAVRANFDFSEALMLQEDGTASLWDLRDGTRLASRSSACSVRQQAAALL